MRYPLIDFHGSNGNIDGDGPAAARYTEARLSALAEEGLLNNIKKNMVDFIPNYSETKDEPVELPAIFPNLLCNPNSGIGVACASNWGCHNLREVAQAIYDYIDEKEPTLPGPDFPTGGIVINSKDIPSIMQTGHGTVKIRGKYEIEKNNIVFTEIPYGINTESLMQQIGEICDKGEILDIKEIRNESNKKGIRLVIECNKNCSIANVLTKLFLKTNLQSSFSYNQIALINKTPTELNLKDCIKIYINHNSKCIVREVLFDIKKAEDRIHIINGLLIALNNIDKIITLIKNSESAVAAKEVLKSTWNLSEEQAKAILDMKLSKLAKLEKVELENEKNQLEGLIIKLNEIKENPIPELRKRLEKLVSKYGDERRTKLENIADVPKEEKEIANVEPEKCVVVMTKGGSIKRIPVTSFRAQRRNGKGIKTQDDITAETIRTNTIDSLMIFTNKGKMYRLLVNDIPEGTNSSKGIPIKSIVAMEPGEEPNVIYSLYRNSEEKYIVFVSKNGMVKRTPIGEYTEVRKKTGIAATGLKKDDELAKVFLSSDENIFLITASGQTVNCRITEFPISSKKSIGVKGINLMDGDYVVDALPFRDNTDTLAIFTKQGFGKRVNIKEFPMQKRGGKGLKTSQDVAAIAFVSDDDVLLVSGDKSSICVNAKDINISSRTSIGVQIIKQNKILSVTKV